MLVVSAAVFAQDNGGLLNVNKYAEYFGFKNGKIESSADFIFDAPRAERRGEYGNLAGEQGVVDNPLELALFSYYANRHGSVQDPQRSALQCFCIEV